MGQVRCSGGRDPYAVLTFLAYLTPVRSTCIVTDMETTTYTTKKRTVSDSSVGLHGGVKGYGSTGLFVLDADGNFVGEYRRERRYGGADTIARYTRPDGQLVVFYTAGKYNTVRNRWIAEVSEVFGVKF